MARSIVLVYGVVSYLIGVIGLVCLIVVLARLMPYGFLTDARPELLHPILWNCLLVSGWGAIHTIMARPRFKSLITRVIPEAAERPTYVLVAGITSIALVGYWQNLEGVVWQLQNPTAIYVLWGLFAFGWIFLLLATFMINHFDLFGLRQVYYHFRNLPRPPLNFVKRAMYRYIRHPIQTGVLIGVWATPLMSTTQLVLSIGFTIYIFIGLWYEEADLVRIHGDDYLQYKTETGKVLPRFRNAG